MKTVKKIQEEIADVKNKISELEKYDDKKSIAARKRLRKRLPELKQYVLYLETNPTKDYCEKEVERLSSRINAIEASYVPPANQERFTKAQLSAMKKSFEKQYDTAKLRKQLSVMNYILKK